MKKQCRLENWSIVQLDPYQAPKVAKCYLEGDVYDHPNFPNGYHIITTRILGLSAEYIETKNTLYLLGKIDPNYEKAYPNAKDRLIKSLT